jgi:hypothetical protein
VRNSFFFSFFTPNSSKGTYLEASTLV